LHGTIHRDLKLNKEISLALLALIFLGALIGVWWHSVYQDEVDSIKNQTDLVFFRALEEAEKNLVLKRSKLPIDHFSNSFHSTTNFPDGIHDSLKSTEMVVIKMRIDSSDENEKINLSELFGVPNTPGDTSTSITISVNSETSTVKIGEDGTYTVDVDSARLKLSDFFTTGLEDSDLSSLNFKVLKKGMDSSFNAAFITEIGKVGNTFIDGGEFLAAVDYHPSLILRSMVPELFFGVFLFLLVGGAFFLILKNLRNAKQYAQLKDDFVSNMTHELKTPISVVNVAIEALSDFNVLNNEKKSGNYLSISKRELKKLDQLVDRILTINKDNNDVLEAPEKLDITLALDSIFKEFEVYKSRLLPKVSTDKMIVNMPSIHFKSALSSIIDNAFKYGSDTGIVEVDANQKDNNVFIKITNSGNGISDKDIKRIFDKFYRVPNQDIHNVKGHGLGLYYANKHINAAGGKISVESSNQSCSFSINLPLSQ